MSKTPGKRSRKNIGRVVQPALALLLLGIFGFTLYFLPENEQESPQNAATMIDEKQFDDVLTEDQASIVEHYFKAIDDQDYAALEEVSRTEVTASPKEVFEKYQFVEFATIEVIKTIHNKNEIKLYIRHYNTEDEQTYLHSVYLDTQSQKVYEFIYENWIVFNSYVSPDYMTLKYEVAGFLTTIDRDELNRFELAYPITYLENGMEFWQVKIKNGVMQLLVTDDRVLNVGQFHDIEYTAIFGTLPSGREFIVVSDEKRTRATIIYYSKQHDQYQVASGDMGRLNGFTSYVVDFHDAELFILEGKDANIITFKGDEMITANVIESIKVEDWIKDFLSIEATGSYVLLKYNEDYFQHSNYYSFEKLEKLIQQ